MGGLAGGVAYGVADRGWVAFEAGFRGEGDRAGARVDRPGAFARYGQGFAAVGAAYDLDGAWVDVVVGVGVVFEDVNGHRFSGRRWCDGVVCGDRCVLRVVDRDFARLGGLAGGVAYGVADRGWVAFEAGFRGEGDRAGARVDRPGAFAQYGQGFAAVGAAHDLDG